MIGWSLLMTLLAAQTAATPDDTIRTHQIGELVVSGQAARRLQSVEMGTERMSMAELTATPQLLGEPDVVRSLQLLPGVKAESEASSGIQVRGGTSAQNAILLDQVPVYNVGHLAGLFSAFNSDALQGATLYKGMLPPQYGGATSAVVDIGTRPAADSLWHGSATMGLLAAKAAAEGQLAGDALTLVACARRSYADVMLKQVDDFKDNTLYFYDYNLRLDARLSESDQLQLSLFGSRDKTAVKELVSLEWTNLAARLSWRHHFRGESHAQTSALLSSYGSRSGVDLLGMDLSFSGHIRQWGLRHDLMLALGRHQLALGAQSMLMDVKSAEWQNVNNHERERRHAWENALWAGCTLELGPRITAQGGLRFTTFSSLGGPYYYEVDDGGNIVWFYTTRHNRIVNTHLTLEPRASLVFRATDRLSLKAGYSHTAQNLHALRGQNTSTPFDRYTMSSNLIRPQQADQFSLGLYTATPRHDYDLSLEGYYRRISHILDYRDGKSFGSAIEMERLVLPGDGRCYGAELLLRKNGGRLTGWLAYTLAWAENRIDGINGGRWYTASTDRRHDVNLVLGYQLNHRWRLGALWTYNTGQAFTAPSGKYEIIDNYVYYYAERNGYRAPAYHRLDVSATCTTPICHGKATRIWQLGIYNLYNRYNPFIINFEDGDMGARTKAVGYCLFGIVPSASLTIQF